MRLASEGLGDEKEALFWRKLEDGRVECLLCPHGCRIAEGKRGICRAREARAGRLIAATYGLVSSVAMDPIEKKPLYHFFPGSSILSLGSMGCNLACAFCQNWSISQGAPPMEPLGPRRAAEEALARGSIGIAYTYNEPLIWFEFVMEAAQEARERGLKNVLVTNGFVNPEPFSQLLPRIDALNIDIKSMDDGFYRDLCKGELAPVLAATQKAKEMAHVEVTNLVIPGKNDSDDNFERLGRWMAGNLGEDAPLHLSAYFPSYKLDVEPTPPAVLRRAQGIAKGHLEHVYLGNVGGPGSDTFCGSCGAAVVKRRGYSIDAAGMNPDGTCASCGAGNGIRTS